MAKPSPPPRPQLRAGDVVVLRQSQEYAEGEIITVLGLMNWPLCRGDDDGTQRKVNVALRIDTAIEVDYYLHGGILPYVLRQLLAA